MKNTMLTKICDEKWDAIPRMEDEPDDLPDKNPNLYRLILAKHALSSIYENIGTDADPESSIADLLADLRHLCDALELDFTELDKRAYDYYSEELYAEELREFRKLKKRFATRTRTKAN